MSDSSSSTNASSSSNFHTPFEESPGPGDVVKGAGGASTPSGNSEYFSPRIDLMMQSRGNFRDGIEHEIEHSKPHWSELSSNSSSLDEEEEKRENDNLFEKLMRDPKYSLFFHDWREYSSAFKWELGKKIAEGGQAEIYEVVLPPEWPADIHGHMLLKVFKRVRLLHMQHQWPEAVLRREVLNCIYFAMMFEDGRFAFMMYRCWGDLRKLIDERMQSKWRRGPPFPYVWDGVTLRAEDIMWVIACQMEALHDKGIFHRDLKASNILLKINKEFILGDFECSIGVIGTGFWRASEILLALKNENEVIFTEKADIYSFSMTCFEIVTGRLPFEGERELDGLSNEKKKDLIIEGFRPKLPSNLDVGVKNLITKCWNPNPNERSSFSKIKELLSNIRSRLYNNK